MLDEGEAIASDRLASVPCFFGFVGAGVANTSLSRFSCGVGTDCGVVGTIFFPLLETTGVAVLAGRRGDTSIV